MVGSPTKNRYLICNEHGTYVIDANNGKLVYGQGPVEALITGCAYADFDIAAAKLYDARMVDPAARLTLASVTFEYDAPGKARAISSRILPTV